LFSSHNDGDEGKLRAYIGIDGSLGGFLHFGIFAIFMDRSAQQLDTLISDETVLGLEVSGLVTRRVVDIVDG